MPRAKKHGASKTTLRLYDQTQDLAEIVGNGDKTAGIEKLFAQLPLFYRVKLYLEQKADEDPIAESLLLDMEDLEIDRVYEEAVIDGAIEIKGKDGKPTAWIT